MKVLMIGVDESTKGGMWTVVENYLNDKKFIDKYSLSYIPTSITGCSATKKILFTLKAYIKIIKAYKKESYTILHVHMSERASITRKGIAMKYAKRKGSKIVLHMHGAEFEVLYKKMNEKKQKKVRDILNLADKIVILGNYWREFIGSLVDDKNKVVVVYNAVNVPNRNLYNVKSKKVLFLGAVTKRKGIDTLLEALKSQENKLKKEYTIDIYGPDTDGNICEKIDQMKLEKWVGYRGWLGKKEKPEILKDTSINVLPSYNEGLPMTILEAMAYGIPSITTNVAAIPEAIDETNGRIVMPGDSEQLGNAISELLLDDELRIKLSKKAYSDAKKKFSIEEHIRQIEKIYEEIV